MKKTLFPTLFLLIHFLNAQSSKNVEDHQLQLSLPLPGVLYEKGIAKNASLSIEAITGLRINGGGGRGTRFGVYPIFRGQYRYYYNMKRRSERGKNISGNSGNYVGGLLVYQNGNPLIGDLANGSNHILGLGPVYGWQRAYRKGFFYRLETGLVYLEDDFSYGASLVLAARIGWVLRKKR